jgi:hypothetical protein
MPRWLLLILAVAFFPITVVVLIVRSHWTNRTKAIVTTAWVGLLLFLGAAGNGPSTSTPPAASHSPVAELRSAAPDVASTPSPTPAIPTPSPSPTPSPPPAPQAFVKFLNSPAAARGHYATVNVQTTPNTDCSIVVEYKSGPSQAQGLEPKTSSSTGAVSWTWLVGSRTTTGTWPVTVTCGDASAQTFVRVS